jgi:hypothetical protein
MFEVVLVRFTLCASCVHHLPDSMCLQIPLPSIKCSLSENIFKQKNKIISLSLLYNRRFASWRSSSAS